MWSLFFFIFVLYLPLSSLVEETDLLMLLLFVVTMSPVSRLREELVESQQLVESLRLEVTQKENIAKLAVDTSSLQVCTLMGG
jgi:hypothetical protein